MTWQRLPPHEDALDASPPVHEDVAAALSTERTPEEWRARQDYVVSFWWRVAIVVVVVLVLGTLAEVIG